jgi:phosphoglycerol transferase MdoB-like AlkP superfamily enzyme
VSPVDRGLAALLREWTRDGLFVLLTILVLMTGRGVLMASLWSYAGPQADARGVVTALVRGFPFDCRTAMIAWLPSIVFSLTTLGWAWPTARRRLRVGWGTLLLSVIVLLTIIDRFYFVEYANQFDHFVVGFVYDDTTAILRTIWREQPVILAGLGLAVAAIGCAWLLSRLARWSPGWWVGLHPVRSILLTLGALALIVCGARGSISRLPAQSKNVAVTRDEKLLNKLVLNPLAALQGAIADFRQYGATGSGVQAHDVEAAAARLAGVTLAPDLDAYFVRRARGAVAPPKHIVVLIIESLSAWPLAERYAALNLLPNTHRLAAQGLSCPRFLSEGSGTIYSVGPLLSGLPDAGQMQSYQRLARKPFPTSLAPIFRDLGYRTRFFYAGYLSWQHLGDFVTGQGFDEIQGGGVISDWTAGNEWGVDDAQLLGHVAKQQVGTAPTLDVVLTTSNHPPYSVDVTAAGFPLRTLPPALAALADDTADLHILGHLWYSDRVVGEFITKVAAAQPDTLFVITGDHYGRRFLNRHPDPWERSAVPGILVGPAVAGRTMAATAGSHLDLIPTLIELCAPAGFTYHALGRDLLTTPLATAATRVGAVSAHGAVEWNNLGDAQGFDAEVIIRLRQEVADRSAVGWWRLMRGPALKP